ncbi:MAG: hypothetical protein WD063_08840 [Pirellulales bacterium]
MVDFPEAEAVEAEIASAGPLAVLFSHACSAGAHELHESLSADFSAAGLSLLLDPFRIGDDVWIAMRRLEIHGLIFHATQKSLASNAVAAELKTAGILAAPIVCVRDQVPIPEGLRGRIFLSLPESGEIERSNVETLVNQMRLRARVHWVWQWLMQSDRAVSEREAGVNWLLRQQPQILAEFIEQLARLHLLEKEDPTVSSLLAAVIERTGLRHEAREHLRRWWHSVEHPLSRDTIAEILTTWGFAAPSCGARPRRQVGRLLVGSFVGTSSLMVAGIIAVRGCHFETTDSRGGKVIIEVGAEFRKAWAPYERAVSPAVRPEDL